MKRERKEERGGKKRRKKERENMKSHEKVKWPIPLPEESSVAVPLAIDTTQTVQLTPQGDSKQHVFCHSSLSSAHEPEKSCVWCILCFFSTKFGLLPIILAVSNAGESHRTQIDSLDQCDCSHSTAANVRSGMPSAGDYKEHDRKLFPSRMPRLTSWSLLMPRVFGSALLVLLPSPSTDESFPPSVL